MWKTYGKDDTTNLINGIKHRVYLKLGDAATDRFASESFGKQEVSVPSTSSSKGTPQRGQIFRPRTDTVTWKPETKSLFELGHFTSQKTIDRTGTMYMTVDLRGSYFQPTLKGSDIAGILPPRPTEEMERDNNKPQSQETLYFKPLTDEHLTELGLSELTKAAKAETKEETQQEVQQPTEQAEPINLEDYSDIDLRDCH